MSVTGSSSSSIRFSCPACSGRVKVPPGQAGQKCRCPRCGAELIAPAPVVPESSQPDPFSDEEFFSVEASPTGTGFSPPPPPGTVAIDSLDEAPPIHVPDSQQASSWDVLADDTPIPVNVDGDEPIDVPLSPDDALGDNPTIIDDGTDLLLETDAALPSHVPPSATASTQNTASQTGPTQPLPPQPSPVSAAPAPVAATGPAQFGLDCGLCGTRVYATMEQVGQELTCPDCHSKIPVRTPRKASQSTQAAPVYNEDDDYRLSEPVERPKSALVEQVNAAGSDGDAAGETSSQDPVKPLPTIAGAALPGLGVMAASARSVLEKANAEAAEVERKRAKLPERPFVTGVVSFLFEAAAATRWMALTLMLQITLTLLAFAFSGHMAAVLFSMVAAASALLFLVTASVCFVAILHDTANGYEKIEGWPGVAFLDWMGDSLYVINALFVSATPGILFGQFFACAGAPMFIAFFCGLLTFYCLFPVIMLSMSEEGSPLSIASSGVWRSLLTARTLWTRFYLASGGIVIAALVGAAIAAVTSLLISAPVAAVVVALAMIYFRLLGRLAWCLSELGE